MTTEPQKHLFDLLKDFSVAMLISHDRGGRLNSRPMAIASLERDSAAYFVTDLNSPKVAEITADPRVHITFQSRSEYASLAGSAEVVRDQALVDRLWSEDWRIWFPGGKGDPNLVLLRVYPTVGAYWDNSGSEGLSYLFEGLKAYLQGRRPETDAGQHAKVTL